MKILNFGSLNIDYVYRVDHFVRAGETISSSGLQLFCGGKGLNQSVALSRAGAQVWHAGKIGKGGEMLLDMLRQSGVHTELIGSSSAASGHAIIQVDGSGQNCILLHPGANHDLDEQMIDRVLADFGAGDILLMQNETNLVPYIMQKASDRGMRVAFNPSPFDDRILSCPLECVSIFILNEIEAREITGRAEPEAAAERLLQMSPGCSVVLTLGRDGVYYKDGVFEASHPIFNVNAVDTTAAGDTFTGYFLAGVAQGLTVSQNLARASLASAIAVSRKGAAGSIPALDEVSRRASAIEEFNV